MLPASKFALGLFHFNPHWNLDVRSGHRHCTESLFPFIDYLLRNPSFHVSFSISGSGLEFVHYHYPEALDSLRALVNRGQIDLIASTYTPSIWPAFTGEELIRSVRLYKQCLRNLGLPISRFFFAQEAFFGEGLSILSDHFEYLICKDDYLDYWYNLEMSKTLYTLRGIKIIIASNHILSLITKLLLQNHEYIDKNALSARHWAHIQSLRTINTCSPRPGASGCVGNTTWLWYHCGDGNHVGSTYKPDDLNRCYFDLNWFHLCIRCIRAIQQDGMELSTLASFVKTLDYSEAKPLPTLVEGSLNSSLTRGIGRWMGEDSTPFEDDNAILTAICRVRSRLLQVERIAISESRESLVRPLLDDAWRSLYHAQISDSLGWNAGPVAVTTAFNTTEAALKSANQAAVRVQCSLEIHESALGLDSQIAEELLTSLPDPPKPVLFGASGHATKSRTRHNMWQWDIELTTEEEEYGVTFPFVNDDITYCPSGLEDTAISTQISTLKPKKRDRLLFPFL